MRRRSRLVILTAIAGLVIPVAINTSIASAVDQDLQVSAVSGSAGDQIVVTSASCTGDLGDDGAMFLSARLISGTAPDEVLAGAGSGFTDHDATLIVPDWIDPAQPAVIEASCISVDFSGDEPVEVGTPYTPVPFDVTPSVDPAVQDRTFSRTSLLAGQAFAVDGTGCTLSNATFAGVDIGSGDDLSGRELGDFVAGGGGEIDADGSFQALTALLNGGYGYGVSGGTGQTARVDGVDEEPTNIPAGTYTAIPYCANDQGDLLVYRPELIEVTGNAPFGDSDLTVAPNTRSVTMAGGSCTVGSVDFEVDATSAADLLDDSGFTGQGTEVPATDASKVIRRLAPAAISPAGVLRAGNHRSFTRQDRTLVRANHRSTRITASGEGFGGTLDPDAQGAWTAGDDVAFDDGIVEGAAVCGDPLADGFVYDSQVAAVSVTPPPATTTSTTTTTTTAPPSAPANAVPGTPSYAG